MIKHPLVSVIIVNWNGGEVLLKCLKSLSKISYSSWELILVDNGSTESSFSNIGKIIPKKNKVKIIRNKRNLGFAGGCNQGYKLSSGKYVLLLNNDTIVTKDFLTILVEKMENDNYIGVLQPKIFLLDKPGYLDNSGSFFTRIGFLHHRGYLEKDSKIYDEVMEVFSIKGACILIRKIIVDEIGLFDKDFFSYFEESDFCWRVLLKNYKVLYYPKSIIYHKVGFTIRRMNVLDINYHYYKNRITSLIKNLNAYNLLYILPLHFFVSFGIIIVFIIKGKPRNSVMILRAIFWNLKNIKSTLKKRKKIQAERIVSDQELFKYLAVPIDFRKYAEDLRRIEKDIER